VATCDRDNQEKAFKNSDSIDPVTPEVLESIRVDDIRIKAERRKWRLIEGITKIRDAFGEMSEDFHLEFLASTDQLLVLLAKSTKEKK
jgi:hypothetical protein